MHQVMVHKRKKCESIMRASPCHEERGMTRIEKEKIECDLLLQMWIIVGQACSKGQLRCLNQYGYTESDHH